MLRVSHLCRTLGHLIVLEKSFDCQELHNMLAVVLPQAVRLFIIAFSSFMYCFNEQRHVMLLKPNLTPLCPQLHGWDQLLGRPGMERGTSGVRNPCSFSLRLSFLLAKKRAGLLSLFWPRKSLHPVKERGHQSSVGFGPDLTHGHSLSDAAPPPA